VSRRSLPERTVDAWVSTAICSRFPHARIWGPTQNIEETNWDYGLSLGDGKLLIFEDKGTTGVARKQKQPLETHRINIDIDQLSWYCNEVEPTTGVPVYYVLPKPPWFGDPTGSKVVPDQAICRVSSVAGPFTDWAFAIRSLDLRVNLDGGSAIYTDQLPLKETLTLSEFFTRVQQCEIGKRISGTGESSSLITKTPEQVSRESDDTIYTPGSLDRVQYIGSALAVFLPAEDLPGWEK